jgi:hypothetical protein
MLLGGMYYYDNDNKIYPLKNEALKTKKDLKFYFHDDFFIKQQWKVEPTESLSELYKQRAQQIRDKYDYVVVCYSGGADSTQILESFYYNNIHIDEILVVGALSQDSEKGVDENHNGDLYHNVFPTLNQFKLPNTKITLIDYTKYFNDPNFFTLIKQYGPEYHNYIGTYSSVHNLFWYDLPLFFRSDKQIAFIFGAEKPKVIYHKDTGKFCATFMDSSLTDYGFRYNYGSGKRVNFYTDPDAIKLMIKQHHVVKNFLLENVIGKDPMIYDRFQVDYFSNVRPIIYNLKNPLAFESIKSKTTVLSARDKFMLTNKNSEIYNIFRQSLVNLSKDRNVNQRYSIPSREYQLN